MKNTPHRAKKRFGQNFLHDSGIIDRLVKLIGPKPSDNMVEIGPGQGALTEPLLQRVQPLHAVEIDRDLQALLREKFKNQPLILHEADALTFDFSKLYTNHQPLRIIGNLPYNISTPLIFHLLDKRDVIHDMHFMLQKEVVERLSACHGNKTYGKLSVICQYYCDIRHCFDVPPESFNPRPKVMSAIVKLTPRKFTVPLDNDDLFINIVKSAFSQRRKTLKNNLKNLFPETILQALPVDLSQRPEQISVENYVRLTNTIQAELNDRL